MDSAAIFKTVVLTALIVTGLSITAGCAAHEESFIPHITQADRPRLATTEPAGPDISLDVITSAYETRLGQLRSENADDIMELDPYGGWVNAPKSLKGVVATGYFQVAKLDGAWWFITPDGNPFVSKGVTDVNWLGATLREDIFHDILVSKYSTEAVWAAAAEKRMLDWGFNTIGPWSSKSMTEKMSHAYIILDMGGGNGPRYPEAVVTDYYLPAFVEHTVAMVEQRARPHLEDKNLIGYFLDNEIVWGADHFRTDKSLLQLYAEFPEEAPGRAEALRFVRESAGTLETFNASWNTAISDWNDLQSLPTDTFVPLTDTAHNVTEAFMVQVFHHYNLVCLESLRALDPNRLILGCRFHNYPGDVLYEAAAQHYDVIAMAFYEARPPVKEIDAIYDRVDKPALIEEWTFKSDDSGIKNPLFGIYAPVVRTMEERSLAYDDYVEAFMRRSYGIGYHWYKWMDNPVQPDNKMTGDNCGLLNQNDEPYETFLTFIREVNRRVERWHAEGLTK